MSAGARVSVESEERFLNGLDDPSELVSVADEATEHRRGKGFAQRDGSNPDLGFPRLDLEASAAESDEYKSRIGTFPIRSGQIGVVHVQLLLV